MKKKASATKTTRRGATRGHASRQAARAVDVAGNGAPADKPAPPAQAPASHWTFLTNHSHVLILLARNPATVLREVAAEVGITERAVQRIIADLEGEGFIQREKVGRQNRYRILSDQPLRHPIEAHRSIGDLLNDLA